MGFSAATYAALLSRVREMLEGYSGGNTIPASSYFTSLKDAEAAAATAKEYGSSDSPYFFGSKILVYENNVATWYTIQKPGVLVADSNSTGGQLGDGTVFVMVDSVDHPVENAETEVIDDVVSIVINEDNRAYISISESEATGNDIG